MKIKRNPSVIWDVVDEVLVLCNTESNEFFNINKTGAVVWGLCEERPIDEAVKRVHEVYPEQEIEIIAEHVRDFIRSLEASGVISIQEQ